MMVFVLGPLAAWGQIAGYQPSVQVRAYANVINNLSLTTIRDVVLSTTETIDGKIAISPINSTYAGLIRINGTPNALIRITYLTTETLIDEGGSGATIKSVYRLSGFSEDNQAASALLDVGEAIIRLGKNGHYYLWLGAELDLKKAGPGQYVSEFLIEIEEN